MHLVQLLLPLFAADGQRLPQAVFGEVRRELVDRFGGLTAYSRSPAKGLWEDQGSVEHDDIVVYEVMVDQLDRAWWEGYRKELTDRFRQKTLVVRAQATDLL
jgi:hypothetical protein